MRGWWGNLEKGKAMAIDSCGVCRWWDHEHSVYTDTAYCLNKDNWLPTDFVRPFEKDIHTPCPVITSILWRCNRYEPDK